MKIIPLANTGFLLKSTAEDKTILIDAINTEKVYLFASLPEATLQDMVSGNYPFESIDLILFTHHHKDHFNAENTLKVLDAHPESMVFSTIQTYDILINHDRCSSELKKRIFFGEVPLKKTLAFNVNKVSFYATRLMHSGEQYKDVQNYCYSINFNDEIIFHCGDAHHSIENYQDTGISKLNITIALLDFPYITLSSGRNVIKDYIKPKKIHLMHLPLASEDKFGWIKAVEKSVERFTDELPEIIL